jgi:predicted transcriptional regulator
MVASPTTTIRVSRQTHKKLNDLARASGQSAQAVMDAALELYRREQLLYATNEAYAALREQPEAWGAMEAERRAWDATLDDGLPEE